MTRGTKQKSHLEQIYGLRFGYNTLGYHSYIWISKDPLRVKVVNLPSGNWRTRGICFRLLEGLRDLGSGEGDRVGL